MKTISADDSATQDALKKSVSSDPFDVAPSAQKKNSQIEEVPELVIEEQGTPKGANQLNRGKQPSNKPTTF